MSDVSLRAPSPRGRLSRRGLLVALVAGSLAAVPIGLVATGIAVYLGLSAGGLDPYAPVPWWYPPAIALVVLSALSSVGVIAYRTYRRIRK